MGLFDKISQVKASQNADYFRPGTYVVSVDRVKTDKARSGSEYVAAETTILAVLEVKHNADGQPMSHAVGDQPSHLIMDGGNGKDMFLPNVKAMVMGLIGCEEADVDAEACQQMVSASQPMAGLVARVEAREITTKAGTPFTKVCWIGTLTQAEFAALEVPVPEGAVFRDIITT